MDLASTHPGPSRMHPRLRRSLTSACVLVLCCASLGLWSTGSALASCVGPQLRVDAVATPATSTSTNSPAPVSVSKTQAVTVSGEWFHAGCDDTGSGAGCSGPSQASSESPMRDVALVLTQGSRSWTLGTADAGSDDHSSISWQVRLPDDVAPGPAVIRTDSARVTIEIKG